MNPGQSTQPSDASAAAHVSACSRAPVTPDVISSSPHLLCGAHESAPHKGDDYKERLAFAATCAMTGIAGFFFRDSQLISLALFGISFAAGGWHAAIEAAEKLSHGELDVHLLMLLVAAGTLVLGQPAEGAMLLFLFSLSGALEAYAEHKTHRALSSLYKSFPTTVLRRSGDSWEEIPIETIAVSDLLLVKPGELFPTDGTMTEGETSADESALTGESLPVPKHPGSRVLGGTLNEDGQAVIRVEKLPQESSVQKVIKLIEDAQRQKSPAQRLTDVIGSYYTWAVLVLSASAFFYYSAARGLPFSEAFYSTMVLMVVASPCALVISIPSALLAAMTAGAKLGIVFRGGMAIEALSRINLFALDKTGTVTLGTPEVVAVKSVKGSEAEVLAISASLEQFSTHPLAKAIVEAASQRNIPLLPVEKLRNIPGAGIEALVGGVPALIGSREMIAPHSGLTFPDAHAEDCVDVLVHSATASGVIALRDKVRPQAKEAIARLTANGAKVLMLSGDRESVVKSVAAVVGIEESLGGLRPEDKLRVVNERQKSGSRVAMTGDGVNDAPSLAAADVAIVMGDRASDAALEQSDLVLMGGSIDSLAHAVTLSRKARAVIVQNVAISLGVVLVLVLGALNQAVPLTLGVLGHEGSTVIVVLNSLRLLNPSLLRDIRRETGATLSTH